MISRASERRTRFRPFALYYKLSISNKILLATLVLLVLLGAAGSVIFWRVLGVRLTDEFAATTRMVAAEAASRAGPLMVSGDAEALAHLLRGVKSMDESIAYVLVTDRDGDVLAHTFSWDPPAAVVDRDREPSATGENEYRRIELEGDTCLDVVTPVIAGTRGAGTLQIGVHTDRIDRFIAEANLVFLLVLAGLTAIGSVVARSFYRRATRPIVELTRLADEVSVGNLGVEFEFGLPVRCWEIKRCDRTDCTAYGNTTVQCWFVDGTPCEGYEPRFPQKLLGCRTCEVYRAHKGDEIVQLADSFRHMTHVLRESRTDLERSDRFQRSLIRNSYIGIIATDEDDVVRIYNRVAQKLTGHTEDEVVGQMTWDRLFDLGSVPRERPAPDRGGREAIFGVYRREMTLHGKNGGNVAVRATGTALLEDGRPIGKVFFVMDLREIETLREDLIRSERLAATGQTVASISHAIKNILDGLRGGAYIYRRGVRIEDPDARTRGWTMVERNIDHISALVADLLNFARDRRPDVVEYDPNLLVGDIVETLVQRAESLGVSVEVRTDPSAAPARLDVHAMHQCLANLVTNAIDAAATNEGGRVTVSTSIGGGETLEFVVSDDGPGVPESVRENLFSGMVSTKGSKGTGLGLLVVHKIVREHGGEVSLDGNGSPGTSFRVRIPRWGPPPAGSRTTEADASAGQAKNGSPAIRQAPLR